MNNDFEPFGFPVKHLEHRCIMLIESRSETSVLNASDYTTVLSAANSYTMFFTYQWIRQVFHWGCAANSFVFLFFFYLENIFTDLRPTQRISLVDNNYNIIFSVSPSCCPASSWPPPDSLFLFTSWHFLGYEFSPWCGHSEMSCASEKPHWPFKTQLCTLPALNKQAPAPLGSRWMHLQPLWPAPLTGQWLCEAWARPSCLDQWRWG